MLHETGANVWVHVFGAFLRSKLISSSMWYPFFVDLEFGELADFALHAAALQFTVVTTSNAPPKPILAVHTGSVCRQMKLEALGFWLMQQLREHEEI